MKSADGLVLFQSRLTLAEQQELWRLCRSLAGGPVPMYTPTVRGGKKMSVGMLCLGKHWNGLTYKYEDRRSDFDGLPVPEIPERLAALAKRQQELAELRSVRDTVEAERVVSQRRAHRIDVAGESIFVFIDVDFAHPLDRLDIYRHTTLSIIPIVCRPRPAAQAARRRAANVP